jgi:hypothetical protein
MVLRHHDRHNLKKRLLSAAQFSVAADEGVLWPWQGICPREDAESKDIASTKCPLAVDETLAAMKKLIDEWDMPCHGRPDGPGGSRCAQYFDAWHTVLAEGLPDEIAFSPQATEQASSERSVNAMLSFVYALLAKEATLALLAEGLDPTGAFCTVRGTVNRRFP